MFEEFNNILTEYENAEKVFEERMTGSFDRIFGSFFAKFPEVKKVWWDQYTPYFNDGDPCNFSRNGIYFSADEEYDVSNLYNEGDPAFPYLAPTDFERKYADAYGYRAKVNTYDSNTNPRFLEVCDGVSALLDLLSRIPDNVYLTAFGDHQFVCYTADGATLEEYEHD